MNEIKYRKMKPNCEQRIQDKFIEIIKLHKNMRKNSPIFYKYSKKWKTVCAIRYAPHFFYYYVRPC